MKYNAFPILLAGTFLSTSAVAQTVPEVNASYLNNLTGEKVTWKDASASDTDAVKIGDKYYKYEYHKPENYTETSNFISINYKTGDQISNMLFTNGGIYNGLDSYNTSIIADFVQVSNYSLVHVAGINISGGITSSVKEIIGDFVGNVSSGSYPSGLIYNNYKSFVGNITGNFIDNQCDDAIIRNDASIHYNESSLEYGIGTIAGNFIRNKGQINNNGTINNIMGNFVSNYTTLEYSSGGVIYNDEQGTINNITANFIKNYADVSSSYEYVYSTGGAISNTGTIDNIIGDFVGNYAKNDFTTYGSYSAGGAIYNQYGSALNIAGNFIGNYAENTASAKHIAEGGAIYSWNNLSFTATNNTYFFSENYTKDNIRGKIFNAIFIGAYYNPLALPNITFNTTGKGTWILNDNIEGGYGHAHSIISYVEQYKLSFIGNDTIDTELGTTTQYINMNNAIINAGDVKVENTTLRFGNYKHEDTSAKNWDGKGKFIAALNDDGTENLDADSVTSLTLNNAVFDIANGYLETVNLKNYSATDSFVHLDVDVENMTSDVLNIKGDVDGVTKLIIHATSDKDIRGQGQILFAESFGDTKGKEESFEVARVYKSPFMYKVIYSGGTDIDVEGSSVSVSIKEATTTAKNNKWSLEMTGEDNPNEEDAPVDPNPDVPNPEIPDIDDYIPTPGTPSEVAPEIIGFEALQSAGLAQTNGMVYNIMRKVGVNRLFCPGCGFYDYNWDGEAFHNAWVDTTYNGLTIEAPVEIDANVWGIEAGSDIQHDLNNKLGIFASYRQGNYEMDGKGEKYYSTIGSEIDIDSYLAGLYYRYDHNNWYAFATVYGGMQEAEIKTDDGVSADTDGIEFGGSVEGGYNYALTRSLSVTPSLGVFYSQINYDDATDSAGKTVEYNDLKQVEIEAGAKFAHTQYTDDGFYSLYIKPSVVQTLVDGDEIDVTELGKVDTIDDKTLGRVEIGGNYGFNDNWSAYGWANYTFGSDYEATSLGIGINYAW